jgi:CheY-like chemotaxis protein
MQDTATLSHPVSVLVVDDNRDAADTLAVVIQFLGNAVRVAYDGYQAVSIATVAMPELVILDQNMPGITGDETARRIRQLPGGEGPVLVALTACGDAETRDRMEQAGCGHFLRKPADPTDICRIIDTMRGPVGK